MAHPPLRPTDAERRAVDTQRVAKRKSGRKARTTSGQAMALRAAYFGGRLDEEQQRRYEDVALELSRLYRSVAR